MLLVKSGFDVILAIGSVTHRTICCLEAQDADVALLEDVGGNNGLERLAHKVPELVVIILEEYDETSRLRVEGRRNVGDGSFNDLLDTLVLDWARLVQGVDRAAADNSLVEWDGGESHFGGRCEVVW